MTIPNALQAVIFDIDRTILDTEMIQSNSYLKVLNEHGVSETELTEHGTIHIPGEETAATWERLKTKHRIDTHTAELSERKRQATMDALDQTMTPMSGFIVLVNELHANNVKIGLASSAKRDRIQRIVKGLGLEDILSVTVSADDVERTKPAPDPYLKAAKMLQVEPANCVVIEDADVGIDLGRAAGMKTVAVPNQYTRLMDFSKSDMQVKSLSELTYRVLSDLVQQA